MRTETDARSIIAQELYTRKIPTNAKIATFSTLIHFFEQAAQISGQKLAVVTIILQFEQEEKPTARYAQKIESSINYFQELLRPLVRKTDSILLFKHTFYFLLLDATLAGANIVQSRLWNALLWRTHDMDEIAILRPQQMMLGYSAYPEPSTQAQQCLEEASQTQRHFAILKEKSVYLPATLPVSNNEDELSRQAQQFGIPYLSLLPRTLPARLQRIIHPKLAQELQCYPLGREKDVLTVAIANPQDRTTLDRLAQETGLHIFPVLAPAHELQTVLAQLV